MFKQYHMLRALRFAIVALFLATGVEGLKHLVFHNLSNWQSHIAAILLCASGVFQKSPTFLMKPEDSSSGPRRFKRRLATRPKRLRGSRSLTQSQRSSE